MTPFPFPVDEFPRLCHIRCHGAWWLFLLISLNLFQTQRQLSDAQVRVKWKRMEK